MRAPEVQVCPDPDLLACAAAELFVEQAAQADAEGRLFSVALAGGSTPRATYRLLASQAYAARVNWDSVHIFWGDERCVLPDHPQSNYLMACQAWLDHVPVPPQNIHRMRGEDDPRFAAEAYEQELGSFWQSSFHRQPPIALDLVFLGMGSDGHTASLFPGLPAIHEQGRQVVAHYVDKLAAWRLTLTPLMLNAAAHVVFLVNGTDKAERLQQVLCGPYQPELLPAQAVQPTKGRLLWLVDQGAARLLED